MIPEVVKTKQHAMNPADTFIYVIAPRVRATRACARVARRDAKRAQLMSFAVAEEIVDRSKHF